MERCSHEGSPIRDHGERRLRSDLVGSADQTPLAGPATEQRWAIDDLPRLGPLASTLAHAERGSFFRAVLENLPIAVAVVSVPEFAVLLANGLFSSILEPPLRELDVAGRHFLDLVPSVHAAAIRELLERAAATGEPVTVTDQAVGVAGLDWAHARISFTPMRGPDGRIAAIAVAAENTTEQVKARLRAEHLAERLKATNEELSLANLRLEAIIGRLPQGIIVVDPDERVVLANRAAERLLGVELPTGVKLYGLQVTRLKSSGERYATEELPLPRSLRGETCYGVDITVRYPSGTEVHTLCSSAPLHGTDGQIVAAVSIFQDITELRKVDRLKDEFLSVASHELKNPLTVLKGYVQLLLRPGTEIDESRKRYILGVIDREVNRLTHLIGVMLDVSRIELGGLTLSRQAVELVGLARKLVDHYQGVSPGHLLRLVANVDRVEGRWDPVRIEQVLANLVDNAIKYSPKGGTVTITVSVEGGEARIAVRDEGVGISAEQQSQVFRKFFRADSRATEQIAGMGLGLYVCHEIVRAHGGRMWLESQLHLGSTFYVALPVQS